MTALEPSRVLVLDETQQRTLIGVLDASTASVGGESVVAVGDPSLQLISVIAYGEEYNNEVDELARVTLRKRRLETEVRRCNQRIEQLNDAVADQLTEQGLSKVGHDATGTTLRLDTKAWVKLDVDTDGMGRDEADQVKASVKARAGEVMAADPELADFIRRDFNLNTLSAYFRERIKAAREAQQALPEHERRPVVANDFIPESLRGLLRIDEKPTIQVRASGS